MVYPSAVTGGRAVVYPSAVTGGRAVVYPSAVTGRAVVLPSTVTGGVLWWYLVVLWLVGRACSASYTTT